MTKEEAKKILLDVLSKLTAEEQEAVKVLIATEPDKSNLRVEIIDETHQKFDGEIYTKREKSGYYYLWKTLHIEVMKYYNGGVIPKGYVVHHRGRDENGNWDRSRNNIENLTLVTKAEHKNIHSRRKLRIKPKQAICTVCGKNFLSKFHGGPHRPFLCSKSCKKIWVSQQKEERICIVCGKKFSICKYKATKCCSRHCGNILWHQSRTKD